MRYNRGKGNCDRKNVTSNILLLCKKIFLNEVQLEILKIN